MGASSDPITLAGAMIDVIMSVKLVLKVRQLSKKDAQAYRHQGLFRFRNRSRVGAGKKHLKPCSVVSYYTSINMFWHLHVADYDILCIFVVGLQRCSYV